MKLRAVLTGGCLTAGLISPLFAGPPADSWFSSCESPISTCDQPRPSCVVETIRAAEFVRADAPARPEDAQLRLPPLPQRSSPYFKAREIDQSPGLQPIPEQRFHEARAVLTQWQAATESRLPATGAERLKLAHEQSELSGLEREIANELQGPIDAESLGARFSWSVSDEGNSLILTAVPKQALDRLLCDRFTVRLDRNWHVAMLAFTDHQTTDRRMIVLNEVEHTTAKIVPASYETEAPEPARLRTAEIETIAEPATRPEPRLVREPPRLSLPIAPMDDVVE